MARRGKVGFGVLALVAVACVAYVVSGRARATGPAALPVEPRTTFLTEPLDAAGRVDFLAALNARALPPADRNAALSECLFIAVSPSSQTIPSEGEAAKTSSI